MTTSAVMTLVMLAIGRLTSRPRLHSRLPVVTSISSAPLACTPRGRVVAADARARLADADSTRPAGRPGPAACGPGQAAACGAGLAAAAACAPELATGAADKAAAAPDAAADVMAAAGAAVAAAGRGASAQAITVRTAAGTAGRRNAYMTLLAEDDRSPFPAGFRRNGQRRSLPDGSGL
jgi:hypothetical protein